MTEVFLSYTQLRERGIITYTRPHWRRLEIAGRCPPGVWLGPNRKVWRASDIQAWIESRSTNRPPLLSAPPPAPRGVAGRFCRPGQPVGRPRLCRPGTGDAADD